MAGKACLHELSPVGQANSQELGAGLEGEEQGIGLGSEARPLPLVPSVALHTKLGKRGSSW